MSSCIVSKEHIDVLVAGLIGDLHSPRYPGHAWPLSAVRVDKYVDDGAHERDMWGNYLRIDRSTADTLGRILWQTCVESVARAYPDESIETLPGPGCTMADAVNYTYRRPALLYGPVDVLKLVNGYEYQAATPDWVGCDAQRLCAALRDAMIHALPGYEDAPWTL